MTILNQLGLPVPEAELDELRDTLRRMQGMIGASVRDLVKRRKLKLLGHLIADAGNEWVKQSSGRKHWACTRGCSYCCSLGVPVTPPEAFLIAECLRANCPPAELEEITAALTDRAELAAGATGVKDYLAKKIRCAFLTDDESCGIHDARPIACKAYASFDRDSCRRFAAGEPGSHMVSDEMARFIGSAILRSFMDAVRQAKFDGEAYELHGAVLIALRPESFDQWASGKRIFVGCSVYAGKQEGTR